MILVILDNQNTKNEVTKILHNSLFTFLLSKARQAKGKFKVKKITKQKRRKTKNNVIKICNEPGRCPLMGGQKMSKFCPCSRRRRCQNYVSATT